MMSRRYFLLIALCCMMLLAFVCTRADAAKLTCDQCQAKNYPYLCKGTFRSGVCLGNAGEVSCEGGQCTCCRSTAMSGCESCDADEDDDDDDI